jgi:uncharacterized protein YbjT (DUF2867 family)
VLGGTGFIGKELLRQLIDAGYGARVGAKHGGDSAGFARIRQARVRGWRYGNKADLLRAMEGIETVFHLARANVKSWADYQDWRLKRRGAWASARWQAA